jgi:hypothetical protein
LLTGVPYLILLSRNSIQLFWGVKKVRNRGSPRLRSFRFVDNRKFFESRKV